jgi:hypothetical protein
MKPERLIRKERYILKEYVQHVGSRLLETSKLSMDFAWYITGFVDGEGCFCISFTKRDKLKTGIEVRPSFSIGQNKRSLPVLERTQSYFGCGSIRFSRRDQTYKYEIRSLDEIRKRILPHFKKYPLQTRKLEDFATFSWICDEIAASRHLNKSGLVAIIDRAYTMNESGKRKYTKQELLKIVKAR